MKSDKYWLTLGQNQGQIVEIQQPQVAGCAEGEEGKIKGLRLRTDHHDGSWDLSRKGKIIAEGKRGTAPTVEEAIEMFADSLAKD